MLAPAGPAKKAAAKVELSAEAAAAKAAVRYVLGTAAKGIIYRGERGLALEGYSDAAFGDDAATRRSTAGFVFKLAGGAVSWRSALQRTVAASTTEAEYMSASAAAREALWLRILLRSDLRLPMSTPLIYVDNQAALKCLLNRTSSQRTKHVDIHHHFARERVARGELAFEYVGTKAMLADFLTKALPRDRHTACCAGAGMA